MNVKERLGQKISAYRKLKSLKQSELAELVNISIKHQSRIENGINFPSADLLENYARVFDIDVANLLDIKNIESAEDASAEIQTFLKTMSDEKIKIVHKFIKSIIEI